MIASEVPIDVEVGNIVETSIDIETKSLVVEVEIEAEVTSVAAEVEIDAEVTSVVAEVVYRDFRCDHRACFWYSKAISLYCNRNTYFYFLSVVLLAQLFWN
jgi:hypothetical protein